MTRKLPLIAASVLAPLAPLFVSAAPAGADSCPASWACGGATPSTYGGGLWVSFYATGSRCVTLRAWDADSGSYVNWNGYTSCGDYRRQLVGGDGVTDSFRLVRSDGRYVTVAWV